MAMAPTLRPDRRIDPTATIRVSAWVFYALVTLGPMASVTMQAVGRLVGGDPEALALLLPSQRRLGLLGNSLASSLGVTAFATVTGSLAALAFLGWAVGRPRAVTGRGLVATLVGGLVLWAITPPYLHALVGMEAGNGLRAAMRSAGIDVSLPELPGGLAAGLAQGFALLPLSIASAVVGFLSVGRAEMEVGLMLAPRTRVFRRIVLPLAAPALAVGAAAVFVFSLLDYSTPSLFGRSSYAMEIVAEYGASHAAWRAAVLALPMIGAAGLAIAAALAAVRGSGATRGASEEISLASHRPVGPSPLLEGVGVLLCSGYAVLFLSLVLAGLTLGSAIPGLVWDARRDLWITLVDAALAAGLALGPAAAIGWSLAAPRRRSSLRTALWVVVLLPLAVPPALTGVGIAELLGNWAPIWVRTSTLIPVFADLARYLPFAVLAVHARVRRIDTLLIDAARLQRRPGPRRWLWIEGPLCAPGLIAAFALVFCGSVGELEATLMSAAPGAGVLSMRVFNYLHYGASETVAALGLVLGAIVWLVAMAALRGIPRWIGREE